MAKAETITRGNAADVFRRYGIAYVETRTGSEVTDGTITVGNESMAFRWSKSGRLPPRHKVWALLRKAPQFAQHYPQGGAGLTEVSGGQGPAPTDRAFWTSYTADQLEAVQAVIAAEIPKRRKAERANDVEAAKALLRRHGATTAEAMADLLKD